MKVLLIHAKCFFEDISHRQIPLGIAYIASAIETQHEVKIYDEPIEDENLEDVIFNFTPDIIGISFTTQSSIRAYEIAKKYSEIAILIAGGIHATLHPEETLNNGFLIVSYGEGEENFLHILHVLESKMELEKAPGIYYLKDNCVKKTVSRNNNFYLDNYTFPARHLLKMEKYEQGSIIASRGCPYNCKFCVSSVFRKTNYRLRSAENVFEEIKLIVCKNKKQNIHFCDDTFTINHAFVKKLCHLIIESNVRFNWSILSRVDTIKHDEEMLYLLKEAGCKLIIFGIESGSDKILQKINKGVSSSQIEEVLLLCKEKGLDIKTTWIVGLPGNYIDQMQSLKLMKRIQPNQITIHMFVPYPGTELFENRERYGIKIDEQKFFSLLPYLNPGYLDMGIIQKNVYSLDYLSFDDMIKIASEMSRELMSLGYIYPNEYNGNGAERTFKTFLDKVKNPLLK